ncbi:MAG: hypothetical protein AAGL69_04800 [Pseudomonadota bacterium]
MMNRDETATLQTLSMGTFGTGYFDLPVKAQAMIRSMVAYDPGCWRVPLSERTVRVWFCFRGESFFDEQHPKYNSEKKGLVLPLDEAVSLLSECVTPADSFSLAYPDSDCDLEISGENEECFRVAFSIAKCAGTFTQHSVSLEDAERTIRDPFETIPTLVAKGFVYRHI